MNSKFCLKFNAPLLEREYLLQRRKDILFISIVAFIIRVIFIAGYAAIWAISKQPFIVEDWLASPTLSGYLLVLLLIGYKFPIFYSKFNSSLIMVSYFFQFFSFRNADSHVVTQNTLYFFIYTMLSMATNTQWVYTSISIILTFSGAVAFMYYNGFIVATTIALLFISCVMIIYIMYVLEKESKNLFLQLCTVRNINKDFQNIISILPEGIILFDSAKQEIIMVNQEFNRIFGCEDERNSEELTQFVRSKSIRRQESTNNIKEVPIFKNDVSDFEENQKQGKQNLLSAISNVVKDQYYEVSNLNEQSMEGSQRTITFKECELMFQEQQTRLVMARDISSYVQFEKMKLENHYYEMLTATVSHDMRTPLNAIIGLLKSISKFVTDSQGKRMYDIILHSSKILLYLVNDHLDMFQLKNGKFKKNENTVEIDTAIGELIEIFKVCADEKRIDLSYEVDPSVPSCLVIDEQRIMQVLINLISNAFKFTTKGFIKVIVNFDSNNEMLSFNVRDSGIGIKKEDRSKLFTLFGKLEQTAKINTSGIGLGLSICQKIVQAFNGDIKVDEDYESGASFTFRIKASAPHDFQQKFESSFSYINGAEGNCDKCPLIKIIDNNFHDEKNPIIRNYATPQTMQNTTSANKHNSEDYTPLSANHIDPTFNYYLQNQQTQRASKFLKNSSSLVFQKKRSLLCPCKVRPSIMIVDDNIFNIITLETILEMQFNINADKAMNGQEAIDKVKDRIEQNKVQPCFCDLKNCNYQLIFMDCNMPVMDGFTATQEIKRILETEMNIQVSIIALTAYTTDNFKAKCINSGMDGFLSKPINVQQLSQLLDQIQML